jgi:hypothetical protein
MTIDYSKFTYSKVHNYSNVVNELKKDYTSYPSTVHPMAMPLIDKLALRHPEWSIVGNDSIYMPNAGAYVVKRFRVYDGLDEVGTVTYSNWRDEDKFEIRNPRIYKSMTSRGYKSTKDAGKAIKIIEEFFSAKTLDERVMEARNRIDSAINNAEWNARRAFEKTWSDLTPALATYLTLNLDRIRPTLEAFGAPASALDEITERSENRKITKRVHTAHGTDKGVAIMLHGDRYVVDRGTGNVETLTLSQLSEDMRSKLGVLKMVEDGQVIDDFGIRVNPTTFYLLP